MTDYSISDGAVDAMMLSAYPARDTTSDPIYVALHPPSMLAAALTYYAEHPEELPQEVRDAVRGMVDG